MRKQFLLFTLVLMGLLALPGTSKAAVTPVAGNVDPVVSTDAAPKWYTIMSSHLTETDRQNRFLVWDGTRLKTEQFNDGISEDLLEDKYLWRLEQGSADNKVYIVNKTGLRIQAADGISNNNNTPLSVDENGVEWEMKLASETQQSNCAAKQYCFNFSGAAGSPAYLNAMDAQNGNEDIAYGVTVFSAGVHQASGWFFYEANVEEPVVEENKAITIPQVSGSTGYRLEVLETILGDRSGGATDCSGKSFTLSSWVNMDKFMNSGKNKGNIIMGYGPQVHMNYNGMLVLSTTETGKLKVIAGGNGVNQELSTEISLNTWTYLTLIYNNDTKKISVYKNGVSAGDEIQLSKQLDIFPDNPCIFYVGGMGFSGLCDELQFFNKALSSEEVLQAYQAPQNMSNLTAWYNFNSIDSDPGSFFNKATVDNKVSEKAVFYKYTGNANSDGGLISGNVTEFTPTLVDGRTPAITTNYTVTLPSDVANGTLTVMNGNTPLVAGDNQVEEGTELTITATPASDYELDYLKINDTDFTSGETYTVSSNTAITVAFKETPTVITYCTPTFEKAGNVGIVMYASTEGAQTNLLYDNKANGENHGAGKPNGLVGNQIKALAGSTISLNLFIDTWWGIAYTYADLNADGAFDASEKIGQWGSADTHGYEDHVDGVQCLTDGNAPTITIPADMVEGTIFRVRIIMGASEESTACGTWKEGSYYDFEVEVVSASVPDQFTITLPETVENGTLSVKAGEEEITNGEKVTNGTVLTITATPASGYILDYLKINGTPITESTYTVTEDAVITVAFVEESGEAASKAIRVPARSGNTGYQFRFDDSVLGEHVNGTNNDWNGAIVDKGDHRARNFTMSVWVKPLNQDGNLFGCMQATFYDADGAFGVGLKNGNLVLKARAWLGGAPCDGITDVVSTATLEIGEWAFLTVAVNDDERTIKLYKNGTLIATGDLTKTKDGKDAYGIGLLSDESIFYAGSNGSSCDVDEIQVWNKTLNESEILVSMDSYTTAIPENLVAFYNFDEKSTTDIPNQGIAGECNATLISGKITAYGWYTDYSNLSPIQAELVDGHILPKFAVNYEAETANGSFIIKNGENTINPGDEVSQYTKLTVEATAADGYQVRNIKVNGVAIEGNTFVLEEESTITVEFTDKLTINYTVSGTGNFSVVDANNPDNPFSNGDEFEKNTSIMMVLSAGTGYELSSFTVNGEDKKASINIAGVYAIDNCQTNLDINVVFAKKQFNVAFSSNNFGTLTVKKNGVAIESNTQVEYGTELKIIATPDGEASLSVFTINGNDRLEDIKTALEMDITVEEALDIQAEFFIQTWTVTCNITGEGSVTVKDDEGNVYENGTGIPNDAYVILTFTPEANYKLSDLKLDGQSLMDQVIGNKYDLGYIDNDYTYEVLFVDPTSIHNTSAETVNVRCESGTLHVDGMNAGDKLDIYNITGSYIRTSVTAKTDVSDLADGCYLVKVSTGNTVKTVKFIKR